MRLTTWLRIGGTALCIATVPALQAAGDDAWSHFCERRGLSAEAPAAVDAAARAHTRSTMHFRELLIRGEPWIWTFMEAAHARGMPAEVALLPAIESGFRARVASSRAAAGMWQIVPTTARRFGLRVDDSVDQRYDVGHATRLALDYLEYLHGRFGTWSLSLAAYNAGEGRLVRALHRIDKQPGAPVTRSAIGLPEETRQHYHRLLGLARAICAPDAYGVRLPNLPARPLVRLIHLEHAPELDTIARLAGVSPKELALINPAVHEQQPVAPYRLWIPTHGEKRLRKRLREHDDVRLADSTAYEVQHGDTLSHIALRHGTSTQRLRALNALSGSHIQAGMQLQVPLNNDARREDL